MANYVVTKQPADAAPEDSYEVKYFVDAVDSTGKKVSIVGRTETIRRDNVQGEIDSINSQIASFKDQKIEKVAILAEIDLLDPPVVV